MTNGWQTVQLGDVLCRVKAELAVDDSVTYKQVTVRLWNKGVILRGEQGGIDIKTKRQFYVKTGQLLLSRIDVRNGAIGLVPKELDGAIVSNDFWVYDFDENKLYPKFLEHYVATPGFIEDANRTSSGTTKRIRADENAFLNISIPLPPLDEQRRIVERVEALAARIAKAQSLREETNREVDLLAFTTARKIFAELDAEIVDLGELVDESRNGIQTGPFGAQLGSGDFIENGHPVITIGNVQFSGLETRKLKFISNEKAKQLERYVAKEGDILFARMGTVGRCCVVPKEGEGWIYNYHLIRVALDKARAEPRYIHWLIRASEDIENKLSEKIRGATREGVNSKIVASLPCRVPPLDEQRRIVAYLDSVQARLASLRELQSQAGEELDALLPSVLDKAFKGEL